MVSTALVTDMEIPSSTSSVLMVEMGRESGATLPSASIPLALTVTGTPAMSMF